MHEDIRAKTIDLHQLEETCAVKQHEQRTLAADVAAFRNRYYLRVGILYAQLDDIRAKILRLLAGVDPTDEAARKRASEAAERANRTAKEVNDGAQKDATAPFRPSSELRNAYRRAARLIHPDRARGATDCELRHRLMVELNVAYRQGDKEAIDTIVMEYEVKLAIESGDRTAQCKWLEARITKVIARIAVLDSQIRALKSSEWIPVMLQVSEGESLAKDVLGELADEVYRAIQSEQKRLAGLLETQEQDGGEQGATTHRAETHSSYEPDPKSSVFRPEGLIHRTERGDMVRSKSEVIIANILHNLGLDYRYEYPLEGTLRPGIKSPDFSFMRSSQKPIIWEHLGMLSNKAYAARWRKKMEWYVANGYTQDVDLFISEDDAVGALDSRRISIIAKIVLATLKGRNLAQ